MLGIFFTRKFVIMLIIGLACVFCYRSFCRFICPLGAIYGMFNRLALVGVRVDMDRCTHCGPCVEELPYFNALAGEHPDDLAVLAVHNSMSKDDIPAYLADKGWDNLRFALDTKDKLVWNTVGGGPAMPQTIVLDRNGQVIYNQVGSVTPDLLTKLYEQASGSGE